MRTSLGQFFYIHKIKLLKPPKTIDEQISLLKSRNIIIEDAEAVKYFLENNNYYRLMGYAFHLKTDKETYVSGTNISTIIGIYNFDKLLRQLVISLLEDFEISFRTKIAYYLSHKYGSECYHSFFYSNIILFSPLYNGLNNNHVLKNKFLWKI